MAKSMKVPVLVIEHKNDIEMLLQGMHYIQEMKKWDSNKTQRLLKELYKINKMYETKSSNS
jgi:DNA-directed RNA polymerase subunit F|tara:strand:+ start:1433 stop:1615 length:183 start_codon:yes stop_codon:yes gene_type:complete